MCILCSYITIVVYTYTAIHEFSNGVTFKNSFLRNIEAINFLKKFQSQFFNPEKLSVLQLWKKLENEIHTHRPSSFRFNPTHMNSFDHAVKSFSKHAGNCPSFKLDQISSSWHRKVKSFFPHSTRTSILCSKTSSPLSDSSRSQSSDGNWWARREGDEERGERREKKGKRWRKGRRGKNGGKRRGEGNIKESTIANLHQNSLQAWPSSPHQVPAPFGSILRKSKFMPPSPRRRIKTREQRCQSK